MLVYVLSYWVILRYIYTCMVTIKTLYQRTLKRSEKLHVYQYNLTIWGHCAQFDHWSVIKTWNLIYLNCISSKYIVWIVRVVYGLVYTSHFGRVNCNSNNSKWWDDNDACHLIIYGLNSIWYDQNATHKLGRNYIFLETNILITWNTVN